MKFDVNKLEWTREPKEFYNSEEKIEITTNPHTDLWQRTYYHFRNDNAPVLQMTTDEKFFSFVVKTEFDSKQRVCHMWNGKDTIRFGIYACSPEDSSFKAIFTNMEMTECRWLKHNGQKPDEE